MKKEAIIETISIYFEEKIKKRFFNFINKIFQERITIMLIPHGNEKVHNIHVSLMGIIFITILIFILSIIGISGYAKYKEISRKIEQLRELYGENYEKVQEIQKNLIQIANHSQTLLEKFYKNEFKILFPEPVRNFFLISYSDSLKKSYFDLDSEILMNKELPPNTKYLKPIYISRAVSSFYMLNLQVLESIQNSLSSINLKSQIPGGRPVVLHRIRDTSQFGLRVDPVNQTTFEFHSGMDMAGVLDEAIFVTADGIVERAGYDPGYGYFIEIQHPSSYSTIYAHLNRILVSSGQVVKKGQLIGRMGATGRVTGIHLHYEVVTGGQKVNPVHFVCLEDLFSEICKNKIKNL